MQSEPRFDTFARTLAGTTSRRAVLKVVAAGILAGLGLPLLRSEAQGQTTCTCTTTSCTDTSNCTGPNTPGCLHDCHGNNNPNCQYNCFPLPGSTTANNPVCQFNCQGNNLKCLHHCSGNNAQCTSCCSGHNSPHCQSNCVASGPVCTTPFTGVCTGGGQCSSQFCCDNDTENSCFSAGGAGHCGAVSAGSPCVQNSDCTSGLCQGGVCTPHGTGGICGSGGDCSPTPFCICSGNCATLGTCG